jgi:hypothetical protein
MEVVEVARYNSHLKIHSFKSFTKHSLYIYSKMEKNAVKKYFRLALKVMKYVFDDDKK